VRRRGLVPLAALALAGTAPALLTPVASATRQAAALVPQLPRPPLPADLVALVGKMEALQATSERFRLRTAISSSAHLPHEVEAFLKLFDTDISGEAVNSPPAATLAITIFGQTLRMRIVHGATYLYEPAVAKHDGGRPWVNLGRHGAGALLGGLSTPGLSAGPGSGSFKSLATELRRASAVSELGPGTIDGQAITGFKATLAPNALEEPATPAKPRSILSAIFSRARHAPATTGAPASALLETFIAASGLPVRTRIATTAEGVTTTALMDIFAIDFPLTVQPPPKGQTVALAVLRKLARKPTKRSRAGAEGERDAAGK
jgi:hypothetical protein